jgi:hydrogenase-4 component E
MSRLADALCVFLALSSLLLLGSSRLTRGIRITAFQGVVLALLTLAGPLGDGRTLLLASAIAGIKGMIFPWLLSRVLREAGVRREIEPFIGFGASLLVGAAVLLTSLWLSTRLELPFAPPSALIVPVALFVTFAGLLLIITRRKALTQVLGYLVLENGVYLFGIGAVRGTPLIVEIGILLDVFVAVFVMGIAIFHINREFDHIDTDRLAVLKDWGP